MVFDSSKIMKNYKQIVFERLPVSYRQLIKETEFERMTEFHISEMFNGMLIGIISYIVAEKTGEAMIRYPVDWWQAFKYRWFPNFILKKWPVIFKEHYIKTFATAPCFPKVMTPDQYGKIIVNIFVDNQRIFEENIG